MMGWLRRFRISLDFDFPPEDMGFLACWLELRLEEFAVCTNAAGKQCAPKEMRPSFAPDGVYAPPVNCRSIISIPIPFIKRANQRRGSSQGHQGCRGEGLP